MALLDLATRQDIADLKAQLAQAIALLAKPAPAPLEPLLTIEDVATYTRFDKRTVLDWVKTGRFDGQGKRVYLPALEFRSGQLRFKPADVEAFGIGIGVLAPSAVVGAAPTATKKAPAATPAKKKRAPVDSRQALKVA